MEAGHGLIAAERCIGFLTSAHMQDLIVRKLKRAALVGTCRNFEQEVHDATLAVGMPSVVT